MPWDLPIDFDFIVGYTGYILELVKFNGVPVYLIVLGLVAMAYFFAWLGFLAQIFIDRFGGD